MQLVLVPADALPSEPPPTAPRLVAESPSLVELGGEGRLVRELRAAAATRDALTMLARAALAGWQRRADVARGLADLAATGRAAALSLRAARLRYGDGLAVEVAARAARLDGAPEPDDALLFDAAVDAVARASAVETYLAANASGRRVLRAADPGLAGFIALSSEDDAPHRPVNLDTLDGGTVRDVEVCVPWRARTTSVVTRVFEGGAAGGPVLLLLHGHASRFEEYGDLVARLLPTHRVVAFDLPSCGYTQRVPSTDVGPFPSKPDDDALPLLGFYDAFVDAVAATLGIDRAWAVGGSLGGNLALRAQKRRPRWLAGSVAWSAGSVWTSNLRDALKYLGLANTLGHASAPETPERRKEYFRNVFDDSIPSPAIPGSKPQPEMWYRDDWRPYRDWMITASRAERRESYGETFRIWHWLVAREQLVYSHVDPFVPIPSPLLLLAGEKDDLTWTDIASATKSLAAKLAEPPATRGEALIPGGTGHSIHNERPTWLAERIAAFAR